MTGTRKPAGPLAMQFARAEPTDAAAVEAAPTE
jgi:hypothetical protein